MATGAVQGGNLLLIPVGRRSGKRLTLISIVFGLLIGITGLASLVAVGGPWSVETVDSEDDGAWDTTWSTPKTATHQYDTPGTYTVRPEVKDTEGLQAQAADGEVGLPWQTPASNGGSPITGYSFYRGTTPGSLSLLVELGNVLTFQDAGVTNGVAYYYEVSAVNAVGEDPRSEDVSATPMVPVNTPPVLEAEWANMAPTTRLSARFAHAVTYDAESDRIVLFGGYPEAGRNDETWAYDLNMNTWTNMDSPSGPSARLLHAMSYDAESDRVLLFGGITEAGRFSVTYSDETWAYDFNTNTWKNMAPATGPSGRSGHVMVYDAESDRVILFGDSLGSDDTWAYDLNTNTWTNMNPPSDPSARADHAMTYDAESDRVILFGGRTVTGLDDEPWAYDFNADAWTNM